MGESWTYTIGYTVSQADIDDGEALLNTARVVTDQVPGPTEDTATTPVQQNAALTITKDQTSGPNPAMTAGDELGYTIVVENTGAVSQTGVTTSDVLPDGSNGTLSGPTESITADGVLEVGESWTYTIGYTVSQADIDDGEALLNTARVVTDQVPGPTEDTATTPVQQNAALTITKDQTSGPNPAMTAGDELGYTIVVENTGAVSQTGVTTSDVLPDGSNGTLSGPTESITADGVLEVGESWTYTIGYTVSQADIDDGEALLNTARVVTDQVPGPTEDTATTPVQQPPGISVTKASDPADGSLVSAEQTITYTVTVTVSDSALMAELVLEDTLGDGLPFGSVTDAGNFTPDVNGAPVLVFTLPSGTEPGSYSVEYTATVDAEATDTVGNGVVISGNGGDPEPECTICETEHPIDEPVDPLADPDVSVTKTSNPNSGSLVSADQNIAYVLSVEITEAPLTGELVLEDTLGAGLTFGAVTDAGDFTLDASDAPELTFTLPSGTVPGTYPLAYTATVDSDVTGMVGNNVAVADGGGDPDPECSICSTDHPLDEPADPTPPSPTVAVPVDNRFGLMLLAMLLMLVGIHAARRSAA